METMCNPETGEMLEYQVCGFPTLGYTVYFANGDEKDGFTTKNDAHEYVASLLD